MAKEFQASVDIKAPSGVMDATLLTLGDWDFVQFNPGGGALDLWLDPSAAARDTFAIGDINALLRFFVKADTIYLDGDIETSGNVDLGAQLRFAGDSDTHIWSPMDDAIAFRVGGSTVMHVMNDGGDLEVVLDYADRAYLPETTYATDLNVDGHMAGSTVTLSGPTYSSNNPQLTLSAAAGSNYTFYADNTGGTDGSRLWLDAPSGGQAIIGPRSGASRLNQFRVRADNIYIDTPPYSGSTGYPAAYVRASGSFTPQLLVSTIGVPTYTTSAAAGLYVRINQVVYFSLRVVLASRNSHAGNLRIGNLPFAAANDPAARAVFTVTISDSPYPTGRTQLVGIMNQNLASFDVFGIGSNTDYVGMAWNSIATNATIFASGFYVTSAA